MDLRSESPRRTGLWHPPASVWPFGPESFAKHRKSGRKGLICTEEPSGAQFHSRLQGGIGSEMEGRGSGNFKRPGGQDPFETRRKVSRLSIILDSARKEHIHGVLLLHVCYI